jgi:hypothetical protein
MAITRLGTNSITGLPDGIVSSASLASGVGGKVLQVVAAGGFAQSQTNSTSFIDTNYSLNITPSSSSSKILITACGTLDNQASGNQGKITINRDSTNIGDATNGLGNTYAAGSRVIATFSVSVLDSPSTTSQITYKVRYRATSNYVSLSDQGADGQMIAMEIAG